MVFLFPTDAALHFALTGGWVPPAVSLAPARIGRDAADRPWVAPAGEIPRTLPAVLHRLGVETSADVPTDGRDVAHWLEALPLRRDPTPPVLTDQTPVLFELADPAGLSSLVGEMLRLGNDRQAFRLLKTEDRGQRTEDGKGFPVLCPLSSVLLRVIGPPYYSLLTAIDRAGPDSPRAYLELAPRVWVEVGWTHPLVDQIKPPNGQLLLLRPPEQWVAVADAPFRDVYEVLDFQLPVEPVAWTDAPPAKLTVPLRLTAGAAAEPAEMWVVRGEAVEQIDALVRDADDRVLSRWAFAVGDQHGERVAVLRARPGKTAMPVLVLENALSYRPYLRLPNLYLPVGRRLGPPLRRDAVRRLLAEDADQVVWLTPAGDDSFVPESLPESAFRPLGDWVEYVMDRDAAALTAWAEAARFEFGTFVGHDDLIPAKRSDLKPRGAAAAVAEAAKAKVRPRQPKPEAAPPALPVDTFAVRPPATPSELQLRLKGTEELFLAVEGPLDDPQRLALWPELARLNTALGHSADATLAWANALWESANPPPTWAWGWVEAEHALPKSELTAADLDRLLSQAQPAGPDVRPLAAALVWACQQKPTPAELRRRLPEVQRYLEKHEHLLPVRVMWLVWHGLTQLTGADVLALARVRDRLLERLLAEGLWAERDLPGFLRFAGQREGDRLRTVRERAETLRQLAHKWFEQNTSNKGPLDQTPAYIDLYFAFAMARLGEASAARRLLKAAGAAIDETGNEAHTFLLQALQYRVEQVLAGKPHSGPLPAEQTEYFDQMRRDEKVIPIEETGLRSGSYAVERFGKESTILQPNEKLDPYRRIKPEQDHLIRELVRLSDVHDRSQLAAGIRRLTEGAAKEPRLAESRLRVLAGSLELASRIGEVVTVELLLQVGQALDASAALTESRVMEIKAELLERALFFAAHYDRPDLVQTFADRLGNLLLASPGQSALDAVGSLVGQTLRSLRKLGLKDRTERLLQQIGQAVLGNQPLEQAQALAGHDWQQTLRLLLHLAAGWLYFDRPEQARPILDAAHAWIVRADKKPNDPTRPIQQYVSLVCTYISAAGQAPLEEALGRIGSLLERGRMDKLPNTLTSNYYYSLLHLRIVEAVVLTLATDDFALGPAARHWLDDDEYLVRRRIHRDVRTALAGAGM
jgi:hypothetical protein